MGCTLSLAILTPEGLAATYSRGEAATYSRGESTLSLAVLALERLAAILQNERADYRMEELTAEWKG